MRFYCRLAGFQGQLQDALRGAVRPPARRVESFPLRGVSPTEYADLLVPHFARFLQLVREAGPAELSAAAQELQGSSEERWAALWDAHWRGQLPPGEAGPVAFFPKAFLQPYGALLAAALRGDGEDGPVSGNGAEGSGVCPMCGGPPQVSVLREEGHGAARSLVCSRCETEWRYKRVRCVACGEEEFRRLEYLQAPEWPHVRVAACRACGRYVKEVDLSKDGRAVPVVDELATIPLDLVAAAEGYRKVEPNLIGL